MVQQPVNKANPRGVRMIDDQTSLRIQQEEMSRRREHQRAQQEARVEKERKIIAHTEEAAARVVAAHIQKMTSTSHTRRTWSGGLASLLSCG